MIDNAPLTGAFILSSSHYGDIGDSYWAVMVRDICRALAQAGEDCHPVMPVLPDLNPVISAIMNGKGPPDYIVTFNLMPATSLGEGSMWAQSKVPLIIICLDHPIHLASEVAELLDRTRGTPQERSHWIGVMENGHRHLLHALGWPADRIFLFPQGAPPSAPIRNQYRDTTKNGILFSGTLTLPVSHQDFCDGVGIKDSRLVALLNQAVERILDGQEDIFTACLELYGTAGLPAGAIVQLTALADRRARLLRRFRVLSALSDYPVTIYGSVPPEAARLLPHCTIHDGVSFAKTLELMASARIVINDTINLRDAGLIRLFYAFSLGTVVASDVNRLLETSFRPQRDFIALDARFDGRKETIERVLADDDFAQEMADSGLETFTQHHRWQDRIGGAQTALAVIRQEKATINSS
jgi:glycosyltransferase involved in cell wall biosynthesis